MGGVAHHKSPFMETTIEIGAMPILVRTDNAEFLEILERRYGGFLNAAAEPLFEFNVEIVPHGKIADDQELSVDFKGGRWILERGDFYAEWQPSARTGMIRQAANPYGIDAAMRILHSLLLAKRNGLLLHASSVVRNGKAFLFAGVSGAGKTTMARLAPADTTLLTDEVSYVRREGAGEGYRAFGTPFAGDLAEPGENISAPVEAVYLLAKGEKNKIEPVADREAIRALLGCVMFFAKEAELGERVFDSACDLVRRVAVHRLTFVPDARVWELIG
jgi:hypothetical protein